MSAYRPTDAGWLVVMLLGVFMVAIAAGFVVVRVRSLARARCLAWALTATTTAVVLVLSAAQPAGVRMLAICLALLFSMKAVVAVECRVAGDAPLPPARWLAFAALWVGMRPGIFGRIRDKPPAGAGRLMLRGCGWTLAGASFIALAWLANELATERAPEVLVLIVTTLLLLPGLCLTLHFGVLNVAAGAWRWFGVEASPLMRSPLGAASLGDFWGKRWNLPFAEMTAQAIFRPLASRIGQSGALLASFLASGVLHDLAISVPVRAGYGLPTLYFALHGGLVLAERHGRDRLAFVHRAGWQARAWTLGWLAAPLPMLFHPWFLQGVIWPLIGWHPPV